MRRLLLLTNPVAGITGTERHLLTIIDRFVVGGFEVTVETTQRHGHLVEIITEKGGRYDIVVVAGGDGTLNEAATALLLMKSRGERVPTLGYIPAGTVNDFAHSHDIPTFMPDAADVVVHGEARGCDIGMLGERPFVYVAAFGTFTDTSYATPQRWKNIFGRVAYVFHGASRLHAAFRPYKMKIEYDGGEIEGEFIYGGASNSRSVGGMRLPLRSEVSLDDGKFEVILFKNPSSAHRLHKLSRALIERRADGFEAYEFSTSWMRVTSDEPVPWTTDGEFGGEYTDVEIRCDRQAVNIIVPQGCRYFGSAKEV